MRARREALSLSLSRKKKLERTSLFHAHLEEERAVNHGALSAAATAAAGQPPPPWLQFWVMCAGTRNGDYRDGSSFQRIIWYFLIPGSIPTCDSGGGDGLMTRNRWRESGSSLPRFAPVSRTAIRIGGDSREDETLKIYLARDYNVASNVSRANGSCGGVVLYNIKSYLCVTQFVSDPNKNNIREKSFIYYSHRNANFYRCVKLLTRECV